MKDTNWGINLYYSLNVGPLKALVMLLQGKNYMFKFSKYFCLDI